MTTSHLGAAVLRDNKRTLESDAMQKFDLAARGLRELNQTLHALKGTTNQTAWEIVNTKGSHAIACGVDAPLDITVHSGFDFWLEGRRFLGSCGVASKREAIEVERQKRDELPYAATFLAHLERLRHTGDLKLIAALDATDQSIED